MARSIIAGDWEKFLAEKELPFGLNYEQGGKGALLKSATILAAIYLASKYANNPSLGIKIPVFLFRADTDTIASIAGGLLGTLSVTNWIAPECRTVQDYDCLIQMAELLLSDNKK